MNPLNVLLLSYLQCFDDLDSLILTFHHFFVPLCISHLWFYLGLNYLLLTHYLFHLLIDGLGLLVFHFLAFTFWTHLHISHVWYWRELNRYLTNINIWLAQDGCWFLKCLKSLIEPYVLRTDMTGLLGLIIRNSWSTDLVPFIITIQLFNHIFL